MKYTVITPGGSEIILELGKEIVVEINGQMIEISIKEIEK